MNRLTNLWYFAIWYGVVLPLFLVMVFLDWCRVRAHDCNKVS